MLLWVYSLGLAVPFLLTSLLIDRFLSFYGRFRKHLHTLEVCSGVLLMVLGALILTRAFHCSFQLSWILKSLYLVRKLF